LQYFSPGERVLDLGCGRGEFMELLREHGCRVEGVDADPQMVEAGRSKGLPVHESDALAFLRSRAEEYDGIFCSNFLEHFAPSDVASFFEAGYHALKPGGKFLVAVPNPESLIVHLNEFWRDATHVRLYNRQLLEFMMTYSGFEIVAAGENPATAWQPALGEPQLSPVQIASSRPQSPDLDLTFDLAQTRPDLDLTFDLAPATNPETQGTESEPAQSTAASPVSPRARGWLVRLAGAIRDALARFLADRIFYRQFGTLKADIQRLDDENRNLQASLQNLQSRQQASLQNLESRHQASLRSIQRAFLAAQASFQNLQSSHQASLQSIQRTFFSVAERIHQLDSDLAKLHGELGERDQQISHNLDEIRGALQAIKAATLALFPPREVFVLGRRPDHLQAKENAL
jgi:hypothetical protein